MSGPVARGEGSGQPRVRGVGVGGDVAPSRPAPPRRPPSGGSRSGTSRSARRGSGPAGVPGRTAARTASNRGRRRSRARSPPSPRPRRGRPRPPRRAAARPGGCLSTLMVCLRRSEHLEGVGVRGLRTLRGRAVEVEERGRRDVVVQRQVAVGRERQPRAWTSTRRSRREVDRVGDVPAVHAEPLLADGTARRAGSPGAARGTASRTRCTLARARRSSRHRRSSPRCRCRRWSGTPRRRPGRT